MKYKEGQKLVVVGTHSTIAADLGEHEFEIGTHVEVLEVFEEDRNFGKHYKVEDCSKESYYVAEDDLEEIK